MANPLPVTFTTMQQAEAYFLEKFGLFVNTLTGLGVFQTNVPWPTTTDPLIGMRVLSYGDSGWGDWSTSTTSDFATGTINLQPVLELFAVRGSPMAALATIRTALRSLRDFKEDMLWQYGIGVLSMTDAVPHDSYMDGVETEYRAKMLVNCNLRIGIQELTASPTISTVNITQNSQANTDAAVDTTTLSIDTSNA